MGPSPSLFVRSWITLDRRSQVKSWRSMKSKVGIYLASQMGGGLERAWPFRTFPRTAFLERLSTLIRDRQYGRVPLHRLDGLRQARRRAHRKDKVSRTNLRPDRGNRERWHPRRHGHRRPARGADRLHQREVLHGRRGEGKAQDSLDAYGGRQGKEGARGRRLDRRG